MIRIQRQISVLVLLNVVEEILIDPADETIPSIADHEFSERVAQIKSEMLAAFGVPQHLLETGEARAKGLVDAMAQRDRSHYVIFDTSGRTH